MENIYSSRAQALKDLRLELKLTLKEVAQRTGLSDGFLSHAEQGNRNISDNVFLEVLVAGYRIGKRHANNILKQIIPKEQDKKRKETRDSVLTKREKEAISVLELLNNWTGKFTPNIDIKNQRVLSKVILTRVEMPKEKIEISIFQNKNSWKIDEISFSFELAGNVKNLMNEREICSIFSSKKSNVFLFIQEIIKEEISTFFINGYNGTKGNSYEDLSFLVTHLANTMPKDGVFSKDDIIHLISQYHEENKIKDDMNGLGYYMMTQQQKKELMRIG